MDFLPKDYESPKSSSNYMKIQDGENKIRILSSPIIGWEDWKDKKPIRFRVNDKPEKPIDPLKPIKHFWAFIVWNYVAQHVQILQITQSTVRSRIEELSRDQDWGAPYYYDLKIIKTGSEQKTKYAVNPSPKKEIDPSIKQAFHAMPIDLEELYIGGDPFAALPDGKRTLAFWEMENKKQDETISVSEATALRQAIAKGIHPVDKDWEEQALKTFRVKSWMDLPKRHYPLVMKRVDEKVKQLLDDEIPF